MKPRLYTHGVTAIWQATQR